jgi:peptidoglycan/LPS O-acetylase OafA/YrhL
VSLEGSDIAVELSEKPAPEDAPRPAVARIAYQPGIDGLRALALLAIFVVHADMGLASGAFLAVSTFFTLSGFLITSLLIIEHGNRGRIDLRSFWARRARRLLPASLVAIAVIGLTTLVLGDGTQVRNLAGDTVGALAYVANWNFVLSGTTYGARFGGESPLLHFWSLAIEEQFYLFFPLLATAGLAWMRRWRHGLAAVLGIGVAASLAVGIVGSLRGWAVDRLYFGTDVRSAELLVGALVAVWWVPRRDRLSAATHRAIRWAGGGLVVLMLGLIATAESADLIWYRGGLIAYALVTSGVVLAAIEPDGPARRLLGWKPMVSLGVISYGAYLFHWPVFVWLRSDTGLSGGGRLAVGTVVAIILAAISYRLVEEPVRKGVRFPVRVLVPAGVGLVILALAVSFAAPRISGADEEVTLDGASAEFDNYLAETMAAPGEAPAVGTFGDSTGLVTGLSMTQWDDDNDAVRTVRGSAALGCSIMSPATVRSDGREFRTPDHCDDWQDRWRDQAAVGEIDVAYLQFGPWEVYEMRPDALGTYGVIGDPDIDALIEANLAANVEMLLEHTRVVAIATSPHVEVGRVNGRSPGTAAPESDPARMDRLNEIIVEVASRYPRAAVVDLAGWVDSLPDDNQRRPDGVHFDEAAAAEFTERLSVTLAGFAPMPGQELPDIEGLPVLKAPTDVPDEHPSAG